tara:strand:- start:2672 stop:2950 length:279 start_codon:yes stop_codon:yes gene_type:complete
MNYNKNDVITVITVAGEYVGKFVSEDTSRLKIADPKMLVNGEQGMGFGNGVCVTGEADPADMTFYIGGLVFVAKTSDAVVKAYREATSGLIT